MKCSKELKELISAGCTKADAILAVAKDGDRENTAEEKTAIVAWYGDGAEVKGEMAGIEAELKTAEQIEAKQKEFAAARMAPLVADHISTTDPIAADRIVIPTTQKRHAKLKAFHGSDADRDAYISGRHYAANLFGHEESKEWLESHDIQAAMSSGDNSKGGEFVPVETETAIIRLVEEYGVFRQYASTEPMGSATKTVPVRTSGMTAYPVGETTTANQSSNTGTESDPSYRNIELVARKWKTVTRVSDELDEDSLIAMGDQITVETALAFAIAEDGAGFLGDGTSTYHGIKGLSDSLLAGSVYTALAGNTAFSTIDLADFEGMMGELPDYPGINPAWHVTKEGFWASMGRLINAAGGNVSANIEGGPMFRFLGLPVVFNQKTNKTLTAQTSTRLLYLGDLGMAAKFGDRRGVTMSLTDQRYWDVDQIGIKSTERFDINIHSTGTATEAGAIIALETPGA